MIAVDHLSFSYRRGAKPILVELSCAFPVGSVTAVTGPSGCGKSTLLYLLGLILRPSEGGVLWDGYHVSSLSDAERSRLRALHLGFVFQDAILDPSRSLLDNVMEAGTFAGLRRDPCRERTLELLDRFGLSVQRMRRPGEVSGGEAQRTALCRALLKSPRLILADEPSGNLDRRAGDLVWQALAVAASDGATVIVATHDLRRAKAVDHLVEL